MLPTLSAGPRMPALRRLTPNVGTSLRETRTDPQEIESQLVVAQCALAHQVVFPEAVHETEVPSVPVSGPGYAPIDGSLPRLDSNRGGPRGTTMLPSTAAGSDCAPIIP